MNMSLALYGHQLLSQSRHQQVAGQVELVISSKPRSGGNHRLRQVNAADYHTGVLALRTLSYIAAAAYTSQAHASHQHVIT